MTGANASRGIFLRGARWRGLEHEALLDVEIRRGRVVASGPALSVPRDLPCFSLDGRHLVPGLVNGHDHLGFSTFEALGHPPYASVYEWAADVGGGRGDPRGLAGLRPPLEDRIHLGGVRNLICGVTAVAHHDAFHPSLADPSFPVRVLSRYGYVHSLGLMTDAERAQGPRDPTAAWMIHAAEGRDERCRREIAELRDRGWLTRQTVVVHAIAISDVDAAGLGAAGASVVWCPESNLHLYGTTAPIDVLRAARVGLGLGSDSPASGVRDPLSNLATARRHGVFDDASLLRLATAETAGSVSLPAGDIEPGAVADLVAVSSVEEFLAGDRRAVDLVLVGGEPRYADAGLLAGRAEGFDPVCVDGSAKYLRADAAASLRRVLHRWPATARVSWLEGIRIERPR